MPVSCACTGPVGTGLGAVYVNAVDKRGRKNVTYTYTQTYTQTEKAVQGTLPSDAIRYEEAFFPWKTKKKTGSALRASRALL